MRPGRGPFLLVLLAASLLGGPVRADETSIAEKARKATIKKLGRQLRKKARSPRAAEHREEILTMLDSLQVLGGPEAGVAALEAVSLADPEVRDRAFLLAESQTDRSLTKPLAALVSEKEYRQDIDLRRRAARALSIVGDPAGMGALTELMRTDEDPELVAAGADSLATFSSGPLELRKEAVKRLVDTYTTTWNLMKSLRPEDRVIAARMKERYRVYGSSLRRALQALTGESSLNRPQEWRDWWNANKKRTDW